MNFSVIRIVESNFPTLEKDQMQEVVAEIGGGIPQEERVIALDRVLASLDKSQIIPKNVEGVKADPPAIFYSTTPAVLVNLDGDPIWSPIAEQRSEVRRQHQLGSVPARPDKDVLPAQRQELAEGDRRQGPVDAGRQAARRASRSCPADENWKDVKAALPGKSLPEQVDAEGVRQHEARRADPAARRAELPRSSRARTLLWVSNTESDVFRMGKTGPVYYLVAGRWFSAPDFAGPWTFATPTLPEDFKKIPLEHPRSRVLASVPGTVAGGRSGAARAGAADGARRQEGGEGARGRIPGRPRRSSRSSTTTVSRAVNTDKDIIKVGDLYYMCFQGVWFMSTSADRPVGGHRDRCRRRSTRSR